MIKLRCLLKVALPLYEMAIDVLIDFNLFPAETHPCVFAGFSFGADHHEAHRCVRVCWFLSGECRRERAGSRFSERRLRVVR